MWSFVLVKVILICVEIVFYSVNIDWVLWVIYKRVFIYIRVVIDVIFNKIRFVCVVKGVFCVGISGVGMISIICKVFINVVICLFCVIILKVF